MRRSLAALTLVGILITTGCGSGGIDPALISAAGDALSATRTAQLGVSLEADGRMFPTSGSAVLHDMAEQLADTAGELNVKQTSNEADAEYRARVLEATRAALDAVHAAQQGAGTASDALQNAAESLADLKDQQ